MKPFQQAELRVWLRLRQLSDFSFPNEYQSVQQALTFGRWVEPNTSLGKQFTLLAQSMLSSRQQQLHAVAEPKKRFIEFFAIPGKSEVRESKKSVG